MEGRESALLLMSDLGPGTGTGAIRLLPITDEGFYIDAIKAIKREKKRERETQAQNSLTWVKHFLLSRNEPRCLPLRTIPMLHNTFQLHVSFSRDEPG